MIQKRKNKWVIVSKKTGKILGTFDTKSEAIKRMKEIEYFKHVKK